MRVATFTLTEDFTVHDLDTAITNAYAPQSPVAFEFDLTGFRSLPPRTTLANICTVLEKHRSTTQRLLDHSVIRVRSRWLARGARLALIIFRPERPVRVVVTTNAHDHPPNHP
jgi:hypothetical protein